MPSTLSLAFAIAASLQAKAAPKPVSLADLDRLVRIYQELKLPIPPPEAPLIQTDATGSYSDALGTHEAVSCGYLIAKLGNQRVRIMRGTIVDESRLFEIKPIKPVPQSAAAILTTSFQPPFDEDSGLAIAVIERVRGHNGFALAVLQRVITEQAGFRDPIFPVGRAATPELRLRHLAAQHWVNSIVVPNVDRADLLKQLSGLLKRYPEMSTPYLGRVVMGLTKTVTDRYQGSDELERLIDSLCEVEETGKQLSSPDPNKRSKFIPLLNLVAFGYEAIPKLIAHVDDVRYSRAVNPALMNAPAALVTVGEVCLNLAEQFCPTKAENWTVESRKRNLERWWESASAASERENCRNRLEAGNAFLPEAPVRWAERRFPDLLLEVYSDIIEKGKAVQTHDLLEAMERSKLDRSVVVAAAVRGASSPTLDHVHAAIWTLERLDRPMFDQALVALLKRLPRSCSGPPWLSREASFSQQVGHSESPEVWTALREATLRADVDLRLELIQHAAYADHSEKGRKELLRYLLAFFGDSSKAAVKKATEDDPFPNRGHYGLTLERVQDLAAAVAASELGIETVPGPGAPRASWEAFRQRVAQKIAETLKAT